MNILVRLWWSLVWVLYRLREAIRRRRYRDPWIHETREEYGFRAYRATGDLVTDTHGYSRAQMDAMQQEMLDAMRKAGGDGAD